MAKGVYSHDKKPKIALYHHSLIKILLVSKLKKWKRSWEDFLIEAFPGQETQTKGRQHVVGRSLKIDDATPPSKSMSTPTHSPTPSSEPPHTAANSLRDGTGKVSMEIRWAHN